MSFIKPYFYLQIMNYSSESEYEQEKWELVVNKKAVKKRGRREDYQRSHQKISEGIKNQFCICNLNN